MGPRGLDVQPGDWVAELGCSYDEYVAPIAERMEALRKQGGYFDRNDIVRDSFNRMVGPEGERDYEALAQYYSGRGEGLFGRLLVYEASRDALLTATMNGGLHGISSTPELREACLACAGRFGPKIRALDHGSGHGSFAFGLLRTLPECSVVVYDYPNPVLRVLRRVMESPASLYSEYRHRIRFCFIPAMKSQGWDMIFPEDVPFHFVRSTEVLEHVADPFEELKRIRNHMILGGFLYSSTFFNSSNGHDPSHLDEHKRFQNGEELLEMYEQAGFRVIGKDVNGVEKLWEAIGTPCASI